jgi:hypothetical protein
MRSLSLKATTIAALLLLPAHATAMAQDPRTVRVAFTAEELDNLVAPVALYPDPLLAQVLIASTFPNQVDLAAEFVRQRGTRDVDSQNWDLSVIDQYPAHGLCRDRPEMDAILPVHLGVDQLDVGFVDDSGRLQGVAGVFPAHVGARDPVQFGMDKRRQFVERTLAPAAPFHQ